MRILLICIIFFSSLKVNGQTKVDFFTNYGDFTVELYDSLVPITTSNFINLVSSGFYDGALFHRVISNFMIQGGDVSPPPPPITDEFDSTLSNIQKTISMANSGPNTGTCQFFINLVDNTYLDFDKPPFTSKHPVFGITTSGFNIVEDIGDVQTNFNDVPYVDVIMDSVRISDNQTNTSFLSHNYESKLLKIVDILGKETYPHLNTPLFYIYENGMVEKIIRK
jgi:peptidylprolyl isomerase